MSLRVTTQALTSKAMKNRLYTALGVAAVSLAILIGGASVAAAANYFSTTVQTSVATSTPAYMTPGTATSTLTYNTLTNNSNATATPTGATVPAKADKIDVLIGFTGSSTSAVLNLNYEYSIDGIDWYQNFLPTGAYSTTTSALMPSLVSIKVPFANTTIGGASATQAVDRFVIEVPAPTKDVRIVASVTGANGAVWMQVVPIKAQ